MAEVERGARAGVTADGAAGEGRGLSEVLGVRPVILYPFLILVIFGLVAWLVIAVTRRDWQALVFLAAQVSFGCFFFRNPQLLAMRFGERWETSDLDALEFQWLGLALTGASVFAF
jgi:hypothetical protein